MTTGSMTNSLIALNCANRADAGAGDRDADKANSDHLLNWDFSSVRYKIGTCAKAAI